MVDRIGVRFPSRVICFLSLIYVQSFIYPARLFRLLVLNVKAGCQFKRKDAVR